MSFQRAIQLEEEIACGTKKEKVFGRKFMKQHEGLSLPLRATRKSVTRQRRGNHTRRIQHLCRSFVCACSGTCIWVLTCRDRRDEKMRGKPSVMVRMR
jgi:hypothetical protein